MAGFEALEHLAGDAASAVWRQESYGIISWLYAWVFVWAGVTKIREPAHAARALTDFRLTRKLNPNPRLGRVVGVSEVTLGGAIASGYSDAFVALIATLVLCFFVFLIARALVRREAFPCFCFGSTESSLSVRTAARTAALTTGSLVLVGLATSFQRYSNPRLVLLEAVSALALLSTAALLSFVPTLTTVNGGGSEVAVR